MRKIWMLAAANIKKNKGQAVSLLVFVMITAMFLNIGVVIYFGVGQYFDERAKQLHTAHFSATQPEAETSNEQISYMKNYSGVTEVEMQSIVAGNGAYLVDGLKNAGKLVFSRYEQKQKMNPPALIGESLPLTGNAIYLPYFLMMDGGYQIGDLCRLYFNDKELVFKVAGCTEEITFGAMMNGIYRVYVSDETFLDLQESFTDNQYKLLSARMENADDAVFLQADYSKKFFYTENQENPSKASLFDISYEGPKVACTLIPKISALFITMIAVLLLIVSLIVIRFRISNSIEENMVNMGVLKAVGYRNQQIVLSIVFQYGLLALVGGTIGVVLSKFAIPAITKILEPQLTLVWNPGFNLPLSLLVLLFTLLTVWMISFLSAKKIYALHPLAALRGGLKTHNFKKNVIPLHKSWGSLYLLLALKQLVWDKKQAVMIAITIAGVTLASVMGLAIHYNINVEDNAFVRTIAGEVPDAVFQLIEDSDSKSFQKMLLNHNDVRKAVGYQESLSLLVDETNISAIVVDNCAMLEGSTLLEGRYPKHENEIALGAMVEKINNKTIGDTITVKYSGEKKEYLITGIVQIMKNYGINAMITEDGVRELQPQFVMKSFYVYLKDEADTNEFIKYMKESNNDIFSTVINMKEQITVQIGSIGDIFCIVAVGILVITLTVVVLVLYLVIKTTILRRKRDLGIQKALGFTTIQLMHQIALNLIPVIIIGVLIGAGGGYFGFNPLFTALTGSMGIVKTELPMPLDWTLAAGMVLIILSYFVSMLIAWRIRKISAYALISQ